MEDAVEVFRSLSLGCMTRAVDDGELRTLDQRLRAFGMRQRKQRIVGAPDQLNRDLDLVQPTRHVVMPAEQGPWFDERAHGREVVVVQPTGGAHIAKVAE